MVRKRDYALGIVLIFAVGAAIMAIKGVSAVIAMEHYHRAMQAPLVVYADITGWQHAEEGSDNGYKVSYTVDGKAYEQTLYPDTDTRFLTTDRGTQVVLKVSPEDPSVQLLS